MLETLSDRGPDSAGFAVYGDGVEGCTKITLRVPEGTDAEAVRSAAAAIAGPAVQRSPAAPPIWCSRYPTRRWTRSVKALPTIAPGAAVGSVGARMEVYKEVGLPGDVARRFDLAGMAGTHAVGHTRMATESAVTAGARPSRPGRTSAWSITARSPTTTWSAAG